MQGIFSVVFTWSYQKTRNFIVDIMESNVIHNATAVCEKRADRIHFLRLN